MSEGIPARQDMRSSSFRSEEHTSELQSRLQIVCRLLLEKKKSALVLTTESCIRDSSRLPRPERSRHQTIPAAMADVRRSHSNLACCSRPLSHVRNGRLS